MNDKTNQMSVIPGRGPIAEVDVTGLSQDGDAARFTYTDSFGMEAEGFIMRWREGWVAYENRCPHWSIPMDAVENEFLDTSKSFILCPMHGAMFDVDTGNCFQGPCHGDFLEKYEVVDLGEGTVEIRNARPKIKLI